MWNENEWYYPENDTSLRFRALGGVWSRRPPRFSPYFPTSTDSAPFSSSGATGSPTAQYRLPRIPIGLITPHAVPSTRAVRPPMHVPLYQDFSTPSRPLSINIVVRPSALSCVIEWKLPAIQSSVNEYKLEIWEGVKCDAYDLGPDTLTYTMKTTPGTWYKIELSCQNAQGEIIAVGRTKVKAVFSHDEMEQLYKKSLDFVGTSMHPFRFLYRCKPKPYYDDIQYRCGGIMEKYIKDNNGQAASLINGAISGLFFSARLLPDGSLPSHSPFGNIRMLVPALALLDPARVNMYFCDFYCNYVTHYVTVVICEKHSETDIFCVQRLIKLSPESNPFLCVSFKSSLYEPDFWVNKNVWVEIYYTENVPLSWGRFDAIIATGAGTSRIGGLPHNKQCQICNLYPQRGGHSGKASASNKFNSTFELLINLAKDGNENSESLDLIDTICALINTVVEQNELNSETFLSETQNMEETVEKLVYPASPLSILEQLQEQLTLNEMRSCAMSLQTVVEIIDEKIAAVESFLKKPKKISIHR